MPAIGGMNQKINKMKDLEIIKGKWKYSTQILENQISNIFIFSEVEYGNKRIGSLEVPSNYLGREGKLSNAEVIANAKLIIDAGNTAQKCGLLPSQLLAEVEELRQWKKEQIETVEPLLEKLRKGRVKVCKNCDYMVKGKYCGLNGGVIKVVDSDCCDVWKQKVIEGIG